MREFEVSDVGLDNRLKAKVKYYLNSVFFFVNSDRKIMFTGGGFNDQPKMFHQLLNLYDRTKQTQLEYEQKIEADNGKK